MASGPGAETNNVVPSGSACAARSAPMLPPAPVFCSMMIGWPHFACSLSAAMRASTSLMPPAGNGTMNFTVPLGWNAPCACAAPGSAEASARRADGVRARRFMMLSSLGIHARFLDDLKILFALGPGEACELRGRAEANVGTGVAELGLHAGEARIVLISVLSRSTTAGGVPAGAKKPCHKVRSKFGIADRLGDGRHARARRRRAWPTTPRGFSPGRL